MRTEFWSPVAKMTYAFWVAVFGILTLRGLLIPASFWPSMPPRLITCVVGVALCLALAGASRPIRHLKITAQLAFGLGIAMIGAVVFSILAELVFQAMSPSPSDGTSPFLLAVAGRTQFNMFVFMSWSFAFLAVTYSETVRRNQLELVEAQALAADAQNRMLRYQINPHFLFNALNALQTLLLERRTAQARGVVERLAEFLRYSLARKPDEMVTLREEVEAQQAYLAIEEVRFSDRLTFHRQVDPSLEGVLVPSLILQPLIENAVKYAVSPASGPVSIWLSAWPEGDGLVLEVRDDGKASPKKPGLGVGLDNISRRLALIYGARARFEHGPVQPRGYRARLSLPLAAP